MVREGGVRVTVLIGEHRGKQFPAQGFTKLAGLEVAVPAAMTSCSRSARTSSTPWSRWTVPRWLAGALIAPGWPAHLPAGSSEIGFRLADAGTHGSSRVGGAPFGERLLMWWNFVGRSGEDIAHAREDWMAGRFGDVHGYPGEPLAAPPLPSVPLKPR